MKSFEKTVYVLFNESLNTSESGGWPPRVLQVGNGVGLISDQFSLCRTFSMSLTKYHPELLTEDLAHASYAYVPICGHHHGWKTQKDALRTLVQARQAVARYPDVKLFTVFDFPPVLYPHTDLEAEEVDALRSIVKVSVEAHTGICPVSKISWTATRPEGADATQMTWPEGGLPAACHGCYLPAPYPSITSRLDIVHAKRRRRTLVHLAAARRDGGYEASFDGQAGARFLRGLLRAQCRNASGDCDLINLSDSWLWGENRSQALGHLLQSKRSSVFCLQPWGDTATRMDLYTSLLSGCIPVIFHEASFPTGEDAPEPLAVYIQPNQLLQSSVVDLLRRRVDTPQLQRAVATYAERFQFPLYNGELQEDAVIMLLRRLHRTMMPPGFPGCVSTTLGSNARSYSV